MAQGGKQVARSADSSRSRSTVWQASDGPQNLPNALRQVGRRTPSTLFTKGMHEENRKGHAAADWSHPEATQTWWHRTRLQDATRKDPDVYSTLSINDHPESIICGNISL